MDKTNFNPPSDWNLLKEDSLYTVDKPLEFILVPKCPLFGDSTVMVSTGKMLRQAFSYLCHCALCCIGGISLSNF